MAANGSPLLNAGSSVVKDVQLGRAILPASNPAKLLPTLSIFLTTIDNAPLRTSLSPPTLSSCLQRASPRFVVFTASGVCGMATESFGDEGDDPCERVLSGKKQTFCASTHSRNLDAVMSACLF
jgi:hypothetical protein